MSKPIRSGADFDPPAGGRRRPVPIWAVLVVLSASIAGFAWLLSPDPDVASQLAEARSALDGGNLEDATRLSEAVFERSEQDGSTRGQAAMLRARIAEVGEQWDVAAEWYDRVPDGVLEETAARASAGSLYADRLDRLGDAIQRFTVLHELDPDSLQARRRLAQLLGLATRNHEAESHLVALVRLGNISHLQLLLLVLGEETIDDAEVLERFRAAAPDDPHPLIALARMAEQAGEISKAREWLESAIAADGELVQPVVRLGQLLVDARNGPALVAWHDSHMSFSLGLHPGGQVVLGDMFRMAGRLPLAARCYHEAVRLDPNRPEACYRLGRILVRLGRSSAAAEFLERARQVEAYVQAAKVAKTPDDIVDVARRADKLSLPWEHYAWTALLAAVRPDDRGLAERLPRLRESLDGLPERRTRPGANPAQRLDLSDFPVPRLDDQAVARLNEKRPSADRADAATPEIRFEEVSEAAGLDFRFVNGPGRADDIRFMYQTTGGGVGVFDFDRNGWPDLWWTQGADRPTDDSGRHRDLVCLNTGDGQLLDVSRQAKVLETRFSQGLAVGDVNADGFPDVMVANLSANRLWLNNGDGTFSDMTWSGSSGRWTTSCLVVDLDGDGLPDLYEVNYLAGEDVFTRRCEGSDGSRGICTPQTFSTATDRVFRNTGDGRFEDVSARWGLDRPGGSGLGIVAARLFPETPAGSLDLFVANDTRANFLFRASASEDGTPLARWDEIALGRGVALNDSGRAEACMGIAVGDVDADGHLDLFVTNFLDETNTLYRQDAQGGFADRTRSAGLESVSRHQLGFGTQFLDADLDGVLDLVVTNGHIEETGEEGRPFRMPPQFFWNDGSGRYRQLSAKGLGEFFGGAYLGRGLARLDFDRDGAPDVAISHLDRPAALLVNRSAGRGHRVVVRLVGTVGGRAAIGTTLSYRLGPRQVMRQLTAGDGFQASNQRVVVLGLGTSKSVPEVQVTWPSGRQQVFDGLPLDGEVVLVEGRARVYRLPGPESPGR